MKKLEVIFPSFLRSLC